MVSRVSLKGLYGRVRLQGLYGRVGLQGLSWGDQIQRSGQSGEDRRQHRRSAIKTVINYVFVFSLPLQTETDGGSEARPGTPKKISEETVQSKSDVS